MLNTKITLLLLKLTETIFISLLVALIMGAPFIDVLVLKNQVTELSLTEITQEIILAFIVLIYLKMTLTYKDYRFGMLLISGFFACLLIRELSFLFGPFWEYAVLCTSVVCIWAALKNKSNALNGLVHFCKSNSFYIMLCGLITIGVFARLIGMGLLWKNLLDVPAERVIKNTFEESSELFGYVLCLYSSLKYAAALKRKQ